MLLRLDGMKRLKDVIISVYAAATAAAAWLRRRRQMLHHAHCRPQPERGDTANSTRMNLIGSGLGKWSQISLLWGLT